MQIRVYNDQIEIKLIKTVLSWAVGREVHEINTLLCELHESQFSIENIILIIL